PLTASLMALRAALSRLRSRHCRATWGSRCQRTTRGTGRRLLSRTVVWEGVGRLFSAQITELATEQTPPERFELPTPSSGRRRSIYLGLAQIGGAMRCGQQEWEGGRVW